MLEYIILAYEYFIIACTLALGIGAFWFGISVTKEIQRILHSLNEKAQTNGNRNQSIRLKRLLSKFIDTHAAVKQLSTFYTNQKNEIIKNRLFQIGIRFFGHISTRDRVTFHMESYRNFCCFAYDSNANC